MYDEIDWKLLGKYLFSECSEEEKAVIRAWFAEDVGRDTLMNDLRQIWNSTERESAPPDVDAAWRKTARRMRPGVKRARTSRSPLPSRRRSRARGGRHLLRVAAVVALAALTGLFAVRVLTEPSPGASASDSRVFTTAKGERATMRLTDGTLVHLNAASKLTVAPAFGNETREVELQGEAYFEVVRDAGRPFVVHAGPAVTRVLGTAFNVSAYPGEPDVRVVVAEGKVAFRAEGAAARKGVVLTRRQMGRLSQDGAPLVREEIDLHRRLAWMKGKLVFVDASLDEVARKLERWYALHVVLAGDATARGHLNATFTDRQPLSDVLSLIATAFGLQYARDDRTVTFSLVPISPTASSLPAQAAALVR